MGNERRDSIRNRLILRSMLLHTCQDMALWFYTREWSTQSRCFTSVTYFIRASNTGTACWRVDYNHIVVWYPGQIRCTNVLGFSFEELQIVARKWTVAWIDQGWFGQDLRLDQAPKRLNFLWNKSIVGYPWTLAFQCQYHLIHHPVSRADASTWSFLSLWAGNDQVMIRPIAKVGGKANTGDNKWYTWTMDYNAR